MSGGEAYANSANGLHASGKAESSAKHAGAANGVDAGLVLAHGDDANHRAVSSSPMVTAPGGCRFPKQELLKVTLQMLRALGYTDTADTLCRESGVSERSATLELLHSSIMSGYWEKAQQQVHNLAMEQRLSRSILLLILRQKYLEHLEAGSLVEAIQCLQLHITPLYRQSNGNVTTDSAAARRTRQAWTSTWMDNEKQSNPQTPMTSCVDLSVLASLMLHAADPTSLRQHAGWHGGQESREQLSQEIFHLLPPQICPPDNRLLSLLESFVKYDSQSCVYHDASMRDFSLLASHTCTSDVLPTHLLCVLEGHADQVLCVSFAPVSAAQVGQLRLVSGSADGAIHVWRSSAHTRAVQQEATLVRKAGPKVSSGTETDTPVDAAGPSSASSAFMRVLFGLTDASSPDWDSFLSRQASLEASVQQSMESSASAIDSQASLLRLIVEEKQREAVTASSASQEDSAAAPSRVQLEPLSPDVLSRIRELRERFRSQQSGTVAAIGSSAPQSTSEQNRSRSQQELESKENQDENDDNDEEDSDDEDDDDDDDDDHDDGGQQEDDEEEDDEDEDVYAYEPEHEHQHIADDDEEDVEEEDEEEDYEDASEREFASRAWMERKKDKAVESVAWSPTGTHIVSSGCYSHVDLWDMTTCQHVRSCDGHTAEVMAVEWVSEHTFVTGGLDRTVVLWHTDGSKLHTWRWFTFGAIQDLSYAAQSGLLLVCMQNRVLLVDVASRKVQYSLAELTGHITSASMSADGSHALVNLAKPTGLHLWAIGEPCRLVCQFAGHTQTRFIVRSCFAGLNSKLIVSGSEDATVLVWHADTGKLLARLTGHTAPVTCVAWSASHGVLASCGDDGTIRLWGTLQQQQLYAQSNAIEQQATPRKERKSVEQRTLVA